MWTYADSLTAFRALPPEQLAFWQNLYQINTMQIYADFLYWGGWYPPLSPLAYFHQNMAQNDWVYGHPNNYQPYWVEGFESWSVFPDSPISNYYVEPVAYWLAYVPDPDWYPPGGALPEPWVPPREKFRVRKSYFTGCCRRRRNL